MTSSAELSVIVPTFNERENLAELVKRLASVLDGLAWEVIFVDDDSPDGTAALARELARQDPRVRILHRINRRGLATACVEGMLASSAPYLAVMDADLQHDESILPAMLRAVKQEGFDIAIGSRYVPGGGLGDWASDRQAASRLATRLSRLVIKAALKDPMSGYFLLKRDLLEEALGKLSGVGFKILLDIFASCHRLPRFVEIPYHFRPRWAGESKLDTAAAWDYLMLLLDKALGHYVPVRFIPFALVGGVGVLVHLFVLWLVYDLAGWRFATGQTLAALVAMTFNFFVNNLLTYRDRQLHGWGLLRGWISFTLACSLGAIANVGIATYAFETQLVGETAWVLSACAGIIVGAVWNYAVTSVYTWNKAKGAGSG